MCTNDNCKKAAQLIKEFKFDADDFPEVKERVMKNSVRYYLAKGLYNNYKNPKDSLRLCQVEDLFSGFKQMTGYLVEDLAHKNKLNEAKGIMQRNQIEEYLRPETLEQLVQYNYNQSTDTSLPGPDAFEPLSRPLEDYLSLPDFVKLDWIGSEEDVPKLEVLLEEEYIGMDSEWRPQLTIYNKTKPSLF